MPREQPGDWTRNFRPLFTVSNDRLPFTAAPIFLNGNLRIGLLSQIGPGFPEQWHILGPVG